jgi:hypothetical protein
MFHYFELGKSRQPPINSSVKRRIARRSKEEVGIKSGSDNSVSEPFFVGCF